MHSRPCLGPLVPWFRVRAGLGGQDLAKLTIGMVRYNFCVINWWNKESVILKTYLKYFSMEKYIGVCRKEDILKHATSLTS